MMSCRDQAERKRWSHESDLDSHQGSLNCGSGKQIGPTKDKYRNEVLILLARVTRPLTASCLTGKSPTRDLLPLSLHVYNNAH